MTRSKKTVNIANAARTSARQTRAAAHKEAMTLAARVLEVLGAPPPIWHPDFETIGTAYQPIWLMARVPRTWIHNAGHRAMRVEAVRHITRASIPDSIVHVKQPCVNTFELVSIVDTAVTLHVLWRSN